MKRLLGMQEAAAYHTATTNRTKDLATLDTLYLQHSHILHLHANYLTTHDQPTTPP
jgi:hypothetical protein